VSTAEADIIQTCEQCGGTVIYPVWGQRIHGTPTPPYRCPDGNGCLDRAEKKATPPVPTHRNRPIRP